MGMDVIGCAPRSERGEYFRNNWWHWRPLWRYCGQLLPALPHMVDGEHNSGQGLDDQGSLELAALIQSALDSGDAAKHATQWETDRAALAAASKEDPRGWYYFTEDNAREFAAFLRDCGGFELW